MPASVRNARTGCLPYSLCIWIAPAFQVPARANAAFAGPRIPPAASSFGYAQRPVHPPPAACPPFFPFTQLLAVTGAETHAILQSPSSTIRSNLSTQSADRMTCSSSLKVPGFIAHFRPPLTSACSSLLCGYCAVCATRFDSQSGTKAVCPPRSLARGKERQATKRHFRATTT